MKKLLTTIFGSLLVLNVPTNVYCWDVNPKLTKISNEPDTDAYLDTYRNFKKHINENIDKVQKGEWEKRAYDFTSVAILMTEATTGVFGVDECSDSSAVSENDRVKSVLNSGKKLRTKSGAENNLIAGRRAYFCDIVQSIINKSEDKKGILALLCGWSIWETVGKMVVDNTLSYDSQRDLDTAFNDAIVKMSQYLNNCENYKNSKGTLLTNDTITSVKNQLKEYIGYKTGAMLDKLKLRLKYSWEYYLTEFGVICPVKSKNGMPTLESFIDNNGVKKTVTSCSAMLKGSFDLFKSINNTKSKKALDENFQDAPYDTIPETDGFLKSLKYMKTDHLKSESDLIDIYSSETTRSMADNLERKYKEYNLDFRKQCVQTTLNDYVKILNYKPNEIKVGKHSTEKNDYTNKTVIKNKTNEHKVEENFFKSNLKMNNKNKDYWNLETFNIKAEDLEEKKRLMFDDDGNIINKELFFLRYYLQQEKKMSVINKDKDKILKYKLKLDNSLINDEFSKTNKNVEGKINTLKYIENLIKGVKGIKTIDTLKRTMPIMTWYKNFKSEYQNIVTTAKGTLKRIQLQHLAELKKKKEKTNIQENVRTVLVDEKPSIKVQNETKLKEDFIFECLDIEKGEKVSDEFFDYNAFLKSIANSLNKKLKDDGFYTYGYDTAVDAYLENVGKDKDVGLKIESKIFIQTYHNLRKPAIEKMWSEAVDATCLKLSNDNEKIALITTEIPFDKLKKVKTKIQVIDKINELIDEIVKKA